MKKFLISVTVMGLGCVAALGQSTVFNNPDNKGYFGVRVGADITCPGSVSAGNVSVGLFKSGIGFEVGGVYNAPVAANFYIEPGVKLFYNTYSMKGDVLGDLTDGVLTSASIRKFGMRVPVMAGYHFDFTSDVKLALFTGPELEIGFVGKEYDKSRNVSVSSSVYGDEGGMNRVNLLWGVGAGLSVQHFYFGVSGGIGMLNMIKESDATLHENRITFSVGYNF